MTSHVAVALSSPPMILPHFEDERKEEPFITSSSVSGASPRSALKQELARLSKSLTKHEHGFLQKLADDGDEEAVARAHKRLSDASLFFDISHLHPSISSNNNNKLLQQDAKSAVSAPNTLETTTPLPDIPTAVPLRRAVGSDGDVSSLGHDRRLEYLENRRKSQLHGQIWRAHECGMPLRRWTPSQDGGIGAAAAAMATRQSVTSSFSASTMPTAQAIAFGIPVPPPIVPAKPGILRATSLLSVSPQERASEEAKIFRTNLSDNQLIEAAVASLQQQQKQEQQPQQQQDQQQEQPPPPIPSPGKLGRGFSDGSRKSVTFNDVKQLRLFTRRASVDLPPSSRTRRSSIDLPLPSRPNRMVRSTSVTEGIDLDALYAWQDATSKADATKSNSSLEHANHSSSLLRLDNSSNSFVLDDNNKNGNKNNDDSSIEVDKIPPIRHPHRIESFSSTHSLHMAHSVHSDATSIANTSVVGSCVTDSSVPPLRTAHPVRSDSIAESALSWDMSEDSFGAIGAKEAFRKKYSQGWASPSSTKNQDLNMKPQVLQPPVESESWQKPVLLCRASQNLEDGEGIEVTEWEGESLSSSFRVDSLINARRYSGLLSLADSITMGSIKTTSSYDEGPTYDRASDIFRIRKSFSDDEVSNIFLGISRRLLRDTSSMYPEQKPEDDFDDASSWVDSEFSNGGHFDSWNVLKDEYENGYGGGDTLPFRILGTSSDDVNSHPHVLSPPLMESLQNFLPWSLSESNFWMKYSMVRDGASMHSMLQHVRGSKYTILAIETMDGEVFGCFTTMPWRKNWNFFGSGESFLWKMRHSRQEKCHSIIDQAHMESEIDVYPWTQENNCFQLCTHNRIAVGGGSSVPEGTANDDDPEVKAHEWGFGLALDSDLMTGTTSPCATFGNPALSTVHSDGTRFEIINLEMWTLTPCGTLEDALKLELGQLFLEAHTE